MWRMLRFDTRYECGGRIGCPSHDGGVELDACLRCPQLRDVGHDARGTFIRCRPVPSARVGRVAMIRRR